MPQFSSSDEVFRHWREKYGSDGDGDVHSYALFAFALGEQERINWSEHVAAHSGSPPTPEETSYGFRSKPPQYFLEKEKQAEHWFLDFARYALQQEFESSRQAAVNETIGNLRKFWPSFLVANLAGVTSNFLFAILIVLMLAVIDTNFSVIDWAKRLFGLH